MSGRRVGAVFRRHLHSSLHSPPIVFDMFFWPMLDLLIWGLLTTFIQRQEAALPVPIGFLLSGVLLWDLLFRSNLGIGIAFLEDTAWSRNGINFLASPLRPGEYVAGATLWAMVKLGIGWGGMSLTAWLLFSFGIFEAGPVLVLFILALMLFGVALAMVVAGMVLRYGNGAEVLAWGLAALLLPISAAYYPLATLPGWARTAAVVLPSAHVFEAMRAVLAGDPTPWTRLVAAFGLDAIYLAGGFALARAMLSTFRRRGFVTRFM